MTHWILVALAFVGGMFTENALEKWRNYRFWNHPAIRESKESK